jgi:flagellar assembly protein FliH
MSRVIRTGVAGSGVVTLGRAEDDLYYDATADRGKAPTIDLDKLLQRRLSAMTQGVEQEWEAKVRQEHETTRAAGERQLTEAREAHEAELARVHQERYDEGHADGVESKESEARDAVERMAVLHRALRHDRDQVLLEAETLVVDLAVAVARRVLRVQAELDPRTVARTVRGALQHLSERSNLVIKVHQDDLQVARRFAAAWVERVEEDAVMKIQVSDHVERGGCMIEGGEENVDARLESQLDVLQQSLRQQVEETYEVTDDAEAADGESGSTGQGPTEQTAADEAIRPRDAEDAT